MKKTKQKTIYTEAATSLIVAAGSPKSFVTFLIESLDHIHSHTDGTGPHYYVFANILKDVVMPWAFPTSKNTPTDILTTVLQADLGFREYEEYANAMNQLIATYAKDFNTYLTHPDTYYDFIRGIECLNIIGRLLHAREEEKTNAQN